jgi:hypothetical protein
MIPLRAEIYSSRAEFRLVLARDVVVAAVFRRSIIASLRGTLRY